MSHYLEKYIQDWNLENTTKLTSTITSDVYLADSKHGKVVLKILNEVGIKDELNGTYFLDYCHGNGCVTLFNYDQRALLIEHLPGKNLYQFSKLGSEHEASKIFCKIIIQIQNVQSQDQFAKLPCFTSLFAALAGEDFPETLKALIDQAKYLSEKLVSSINKKVLLHGDLHHENVISRASGEFVCFDPKGFVGDPAYELGTTLKNPWHYPQISQDIEKFQQRAMYFAKELQIPYERIIGYAFIHLCLSISWAISDNNSYDHQFILAQKVSRIL